MSKYTELKMIGPNDDNMAVDHHVQMENDFSDRINTTETRLHSNEGICILQETVFVDSEILDEQIFENLKVKVESAFVDDEEVLEQGSEDDDNTLNTRVKKKKKKFAQVKKKKIAKDRVAAMREKLKNKLRKNSDDEESSQKDGRKLRVNNPELDIYKTITDDSGNEVQVKVEETADERRRRLARERMRRKRMNMTEFERQVAMRKQRIQKQKLRLRQRLEETEEEAEARKKEYREQKRKSRQRMREISESTGDEDSRRCLSSFTTSDGEVVLETPDERERRLARERQRKRRYRIAEIEREIELERLQLNQPSIKEVERDNETEDERELRRLKYRLQKQRSRQRLKELSELDDVTEPELSMDLDSDRRVSQNDICVDFYKNNRKKRAPDDIEYLYFYENSEERRKRLDRERHKAKYRARKQMEREVLDIEEESDMMTSRRCLDFD